MLYNLPKWIQQIEIAYVAQIQTEIHKIIEQTPEQNLTAELEKTQDQYPFEIAVYDGKNIIYRSLPGIERNELRNSLTEGALAYEADGIITGAAKEYSVWYAIYHPTITEYFTKIMFYLFICIGIAFILLFTLVYLLHRMLSNPLQQIKENLNKLEKYELDSIPLEADDVINEQMIKFASNLSGRIKAVSREHTELEYALQLERERLSNMIVIARALIHDLKIPIHKAIIDTDFYGKKHPEISFPTQNFLTENITHLDETIQLINDALHFIDTDAKRLAEVVDDFDIVPLFTEIRNSFQRQFEERELWLDAIMDETLPVIINKVVARLIIHNMFSNIAKYALSASDITFEIFMEAGWLNIQCQNEASAQNIERIQQSEELFHAVLEEDDIIGAQEYVYSTGNGLYLVKELAKITGGFYDLTTTADTVEITVKIKC